MVTDPRLGLAQKYAASGLFDDAWQVLNDVLAQDGGDLATLRLAAAVEIERRNFATAIVFCRKVLAVEAGDAETQFNLAVALEQTGELESAAEVYRRSLALNEKQAVAWSNLGSVLDRLGRAQDALEAMHRALALDPENAPAHSNQGVVLLGQGRLSGARDAFQRALAKDPSNAGARVNLGVVEVELGDVRAGLKHFDLVLAEDKHHHDAWDNKLFSAHYTSDDPVELLDVHRTWGSHHARLSAPVTKGSLRRKLRVGYVSPDFKRHSVAFFAEPLIAAHNRDVVSVVCYSNAYGEDDVTARFKDLAEGWRNIAALDTAAAVALIKSDDIDILVDLAGHTVGHRLDIFAARAAPVQVTALGYPNTTGLPAIDARLVDGITDPIETADAWATERLVRLPHLHCYAPLAEAPGVAPLPRLKNGFCTFGSFNKRAKISAETIHMWAAILSAVPGSRLLLKAKALADPCARTMLAAQFAEHKIAGERLDLQGWTTADRDHLNLYNQIDIALDTYPYNGTTTTCEALWMGVPVITRAGVTHAARVGASLLVSVGLPHLVAKDRVSYVASAVELAGDAGRLAQMRAGLRSQMMTSPLCQPRAYAASVEAAYQDLWAVLCSASSLTDN